MSWPLSHDYNEAIQTPKLAFTDPDLKAGEAVVGARGLPLPRSGNFADVYQVRGFDGKDWAVKCFTRPVVGLDERYARVSEALEKAKLPFVVGFTFLAEGIRVGGVWRPAVKMEWVEGLLLNQVVRENAAKPPVLAALGLMWVRLCKRLREAKIAHADLQHGNVLLVPGSRPGAYGLKLIDYDGMHVPALANQPSGEVGHPAYQHPARTATRAYSPDLDRFPHLVVLTALKGLEVAGSPLWDRYDTGDNLLFSEEDFKKPASSKLMRELWHTGNPSLQSLVGRLAVACGKPIPQTQWIDDIAPEGEVKPLDDATRRTAAEALGVALPVAAALPPEPTYGAAPVMLAQEVDVELVEDRKPAAKTEKREERKRPAYRPPTRGEKSNSRVLLIVGGILLLAGGVAAAIALSGNRQEPDTAQKPNGDAEPKEKEPKLPKDKDPKEKEPKEKEPKEKEPKEKNPKEKEPKDKSIDPLPLKAPDLKPVGKLQVKERWTAELGTDPPAIRLAVGTDSRLIAVTGFSIGSFCLDAATGTRLPGSANKIFQPIRGGIGLDGGRFAAVQTKADAAVPIWNPKAQAWDEPIKPIGGGLSTGGQTFVSPNARYLAFASAGAKDSPGSFKLKDVEKDEVVLDLELTRVHAFFTADSGRVLVADQSGKCSWFQLPSGKPDGEWTYQKQGSGGLGPLAVSRNGEVVFLQARLPGSNEFYHLLDGRSGQVVRSFPGSYTSQRGNPLSVDGRLAAFVMRGPNATSTIEVIETATGNSAARLTASAGKEFISADLLPDGSAVIAVVGEPPVAKKPERQQTAVCYDLVPEASVKPKDPPVTYPPVPVEPGKLHPRWIANADVGRDAPRIHADADAGVVLVGGPVAGHAVLDLKTGAPHEGFTDLGKNGIADFFALSGGRVGSVTQSMLEVRVWDAKTGKETGLIDIPDIPPGTGHAKALRAEVSPDEKYVAIGRAGVAVADNPEVPFRVFDAATGKALVSATWRGGSLHFTADSSRLLVAEWSGRVRWFKLPSGEQAGGWEFGVPPPGQRHLVYGISADGATVAYKGPAGLKSNESWPGLVNGTTGEVTRRFSKHHFASDVSLSADGKRAALLQEVTPDACTFDVVDAATGNSLGTTRLVTGRRVPSFVLSADGAMLFVHDPAANKLHRFDVVPPKSP